MKMPKQISDAIRILVWCYRSGDELAKVATIAEDLDLTRQMALKLSNILRKLGLLETTRGPSGGIRLTPIARDASVGAVVRALLTRPEIRKEAREDSDFGGLYDEAFNAFLAVLDEEKLSELAARSQASQKAKRGSSGSKNPARQRSKSRRADPVVRTKSKSSRHKSQQARTRS